MTGRRRIAALGCLWLLCAGCRAPAGHSVSVGSKEFPESLILGQAMADLARSSGGVRVQHRSGLGGTELVYRPLLQGDIDAYPDYTGTIAQVLMKSAGQPTPEEMRRYLARQGIGMTATLGFNDGYAIAVSPQVQERFGLRKISDLAAHPDLRLGFTQEFIKRPDGWPGIERAYGLRMNDVRGMQHQLAYTAIASGQIDGMEIYTTDAKIQKLGLRLLEDDRRFFPRYDAVILYRLDLQQRAPRALQAMERLVGKISEEKMIRANAMVEIDGRPYADAAAALLRDALGEGSAATAARGGGEDPRLRLAREIGGYTLQHLELVGISLLGAILAGVPLGVLATRGRVMRGITLSTVGLLQTVPSLALLALLIPRMGIGNPPALMALFLYGLLPIVRSTYTGLATIPPNLLEAAEALGLTRAAQLFRIHLPLASPSIMAGIKTSAVINVGTATIAAFIGAGGLGVPIKQGIDLQRNDLLLEGAIPAAVLALVVQGVFDLLDRVVIPRGLRATGK